MNSESLATPVQSNDKRIIDQLLQRIEQLEKENIELKQKLDFYKNKEGVLITEATKEKNKML